MKNLVLLIVITDLYISSESESAAGSKLHMVQNFEHRSLSGAVVANESYTLTFLDLKRNITEKLIIRERLGKSFNCQNVFAAFDGRCDSEVHRIVQILGLFNSFHFVQHLFAAFCASYGLFAIKLLEFTDNSFLMLDLGFGLHPCLKLRIPELLFLFCICRIIAGESACFSALDFNNLCDDTVEEITVMRNDKYSTAVISKEGFEPLYRCEIQVVRRLIEYDEVGFLQQELTQSDTCLLTAGEGIDDLIKFVFGKTKTFEYACDLALNGITVSHFEIVLQSRVAVHCFFQIIARQVLHALFEITEFLFFIEEILLYRQEFFIDSVTAINGFLLGEITPGCT